MTGVVVVLGLAELIEGRPEVPAPVVTGHREGADRVQRPGDVPDPLVDRAVGHHEPTRLTGFVGRWEPEQVERVAHGVWRQPQQRAPDRLPEDRREHDLTERAKVGRREVGQLAVDDRLDRGVTDEGGQPRVREPPLAVGPQQSLEHGEPVQVVEVGQRAWLRLGPVIGQAGEERCVVRWVPR
jgi:hypothetical protein